mmetsp:Transcript_28913/g.83861  ORF Transcript_28913/g.83861 Transcript_28913/m.83861 type:complete len:255 (-) Transcript_28913:131-895(-)
MQAIEVAVVRLIPQPRLHDNTRPKNAFPLVDRLLTNARIDMASQRGSARMPCIALQSQGITAKDRQPRFRSGLLAPLSHHRQRRSSSRRFCRRCLRLVCFASAPPIFHTPFQISRFELQRNDSLTLLVADGLQEHMSVMPRAPGNDGRGVRGGHGAGGTVIRNGTSKRIHTSICRARVRADSRTVVGAVAAAARHVQPRRSFRALCWLYSTPLRVRGPWMGGLRPEACVHLPVEVVPKLSAFPNPKHLQHPAEV